MTDSAPEFYECDMDVPSKVSQSCIFMPRERAVPLPWAFFVDDGGGCLTVTNVKSGVLENLIAPVDAMLFVYSLPALFVGRLRWPARAEVTLYNPTAKNVKVHIWIGERSALAAKLLELQK